MAKKNGKHTSVRDKWIFIIIIFVVLFIFFLAIKPSHVKAPTQTNSSSSESTNWKTLENTELEYSIKIPPSWGNRYDSEFNNTNADYPGLSIFKDKKDLGASIYIMVFNKPIKNPYYQNIFTIIDSEYELDGVKGFRNTDFKGVLPSDTVAVEKNNKIYIISNVKHPQGSPITQEEFNQIISTFKFIDSVGSFCGGFAGKSCPSGYSCKLDGNYPDAGGMCVKQSTLNKASEKLNNFLQSF